MRSRLIVRSVRLAGASACALGIIVFAPRAAHAQGGTASQPPPPQETEVFPPPQPVQEDWTAKPGLQLGVRTGIAGGTGVVYSGFPVNDGSYGFVPVILDVGLRLIPEAYLGVYGGFGFVTNKANATSCPDNFNCSTKDWRMGIHADWHILPRLRWDPYVGINFGYEILQENLNGNTFVPVAPGVAAPGNVAASVTDRGWEYVGVTLGFDYRLSRYAAVGAFLSASLNQYNVHAGTQTVTVAGQSLTTPLPDVQHGMHEIYTAGFRATFDMPFEGRTQPQTVAGR
jgi:hypothetical protein